MAARLPDHMGKWHLTYACGLQVRCDTACIPFRRMKLGESYVSFAPALVAYLPSILASFLPFVQCDTDVPCRGLCFNLRLDLRSVPCGLGLYRRGLLRWWFVHPYWFRRSRSLDVLVRAGVLRKVFQQSWQ